MEDVQSAYPGQPVTSGMNGFDWSANGRYVAYTASTIGLPDTNPESDVVLRDRQTGALEIVSVTTAGTQLPVYSEVEQVSDDGRFVTFVSIGAFVAGDTNGVDDVYVRDRQAGTTTRVTVGTGGVQLPDRSPGATMSEDGRYFAFMTDFAIDGTDTNGLTDVYRYDRVSDTTTLVSRADDEATFPLNSILFDADSAGNRIHFTTETPLPGFPGAKAWLIRDVAAGTTMTVPAESTLQRSGLTVLVNTPDSHSAADTNTANDAYLFDLATSAWTLISDRAFDLPATGNVWGGPASTDLRYVLLSHGSPPTNRVVLDRNTGVVRFAGGDAWSISDDGTEAAGELIYRVGRPHIETVTPTPGLIRQGLTATLMVTGQELNPGTTFDFGSGIDVSNVVATGRQATMTITIAGWTPVGPHAATAVQPGGCRATLAGAINVSASAAPPIVTSVSPALIRPDTSTSVQIRGSGFQPTGVVSSPLQVTQNLAQPTSIDAFVYSYGATEGIKSVTVTNSDNQASTLDAAMLVRSSRGEFHPFGPSRILDTRFGNPIGPGETREVPVVGPGALYAHGVRAVLMNVTVVHPTAPSYLTIFPSGSARPNSSSLNFVPRQTVPNLVTATVGANGKVSIFNESGSAHVLFDVVGWYSEYGTTTGGAFVGVSPIRALDTRVDFDAPLGPLEYISLPVAASNSSIAAVMMNVTVTAPTTTSFLTVWPSGLPLPNASNLNFVRDQTVANLVVAPVGADGRVNLFNFAGQTDVIADIVGVFENGTIPVVDGQYESQQPFRALDTRVRGGRSPLGPQVTLELDARALGVPDDASVLMMNVTAVDPTADGYLTAFPGDETLPATSNLNFRANQNVPNAVAMQIGSNRKIKLFNAYGDTHVIVDVTGWYRPGFAFGQSSLTPTNKATNVAPNGATSMPDIDVAEWLSNERPSLVR